MHDRTEGRPVTSYRSSDVAGEVQPRAPVNRIAIVLGALRAGGAERMVSLLTQHWIGLGRQVTIITFEAPGRRPYFPLAQGVSLVQLGHEVRSRSRVSGVIRTTRRVLALRAALRRERPDVIVSFLTKMNVLTLLAARRLPQPVIVCERNNPLEQGAHALWWHLHERLRHRATLVLQTQASLAAVRKPHQGRIRTIANILEMGPHAEGDGTACARPKAVVAVGRLVPQKGFDLLLEAFAQVAPQHPAWSLVIWGEGPERDRLEAQRRAMGLEGRVELPGVSAVPRSWVHSGRIFVLSSRFEGFPNVLLEAMAGGLAAISVDCPWGPAEIIRDGEDGLLVPPGNADALAGALGRVMADASMRDALAGAARRNVRRFAKEAVLPEWERLLAKVVAET